MEGNHTLFGQGANTDQSDIPTHGSKGHQSRNSVGTRPSHTPVTNGPRGQPMEQRRRSVGPLGGRAADLPMGPTTLSLRRGSSSLDGEVGSRCPVHNSRPWRGWLPSIYMRAGAPFQDITKHRSNQVTLSRCSSSSLVDVLGLEEFRFES